MYTQYNYWYPFLYFFPQILSVINEYAHLFRKNFRNRNSRNKIERVIHFQNSQGPIGQPKREKPMRVTGISGGSGDCEAYTDSGMYRMDFYVVCTGFSKRMRIA